MVELDFSEKRTLVEALRTDYSVPQICEILSFNQSSLYYQPKSDTSDEVLQDEILRLSERYPKYGNHRRITKAAGAYGIHRWLLTRRLIDESR